MTLKIRKAALEDLEALIKIYSEDLFGFREDFQQPLPERYKTAFEKITSNPLHELMVAEIQGEIVGTFQLSKLTYLSYQGGTRFLIENVYVKNTHTGMGVGKKMFGYIKEKAMIEEVHLIQLTTNKQRPDAKRFYESVGFTATHEGMKLHL